MSEHDLKPDTASAIAFLSRWFPDSPWVLTSIIPDGKTDTRTFQPNQNEAAARWIEERQGVQNLYFHVNPVRRDLNVKASKEDIARLAWLHVDIDPRAGEDHDEERARAFRLLQEFKLRPTVIVDSGGGYQGFWKLNPDSRLEINGIVTRAQELEVYNIQLEKVFGADHCHNVDRIMRIPGTINVPTARKLKKGRKPYLASLVEWNEVSYNIDQFTPAVRVQPKDPGLLAGGQPRVKVTGNVPVVGTDELREWAKENGKTISDHTLALIATGEDPINPGKYGSRSEALFKVCCDLVRADVNREIIFSVITGPNGIAESVREKRGSEAYAWRQIERAEEKAINPVLLEMNERHFIVQDHGGKTRVMTRLYDAEMKRDKLVSQAKEDLTLYYANRRVSLGEDKQAPVGTWWLAHPRRRQFETMFFDPGKKGDGVDQPGHYNLWRSWAVDPVRGDWSLMRHHIEAVLASDNAEYADYIVRWAAWAVQNPDQPEGVALVFRGGKGTGKGTFARALCSVFGQHGMQVFSPVQVTGKFNAHLRDCCLLFADEAVRPGRDGGESQLKGMITEPLLPIEGKGKDTISAQNRLHVVMASNIGYVVPASADERRFAVFDVPTLFATKSEQKAYFTPLYGQMEAGGLAAMLFDLLEMDLGDWHPRWHIPATKALAHQQRENLAGIEAVVFDLLLADGWGVLAKAARNGRFVATEALREYASNWLGKTGGPEDHVSAFTIRELLGALGCTKYRVGGGGENGYLLPSTREMRQRWNAVRFKWWDDDPEADAESETEIDADPIEKSPF